MQESKYITINTKSLFEEFTSGNENLEITKKGLRLQSRIRELVNIKSWADLDPDFLRNHTFYRISIKNTNLILTSHKAFGEIQSLDLSRYFDEEVKNVVVLETESNIRNETLKGSLYLIENSPLDLGPLDLGSDKPDEIKGFCYSKAIDSRVQQTRWYRFTLEGKFPEGTNVEFHYYISDEEVKELPKNVLWEKGLSGSSAIQGEKIRDAIFRTETKGRYLWFKITLIGTEDLSPEIYSVMIFFPKVSYLEYLPSVYREDVANNDFLDRFLAIFESLFFDIDFTIDHLSRWLDAAGTPLEFLYWLGSWIGVEQGRVESLYRKEIPEAKQREYISQAVSMYKERGTKTGLENLISFYTGKEPIIIENLPFECTKGSTENENWKKDQNVINEIDETKLGRSNFSFLVLFKEELDEDEKVLIRNIIEAEKPAHTTYKLLELRFCLDGNTYLGINTKLPPLTPLV